MSPQDFASSFPRFFASCTPGQKAVVELLLDGSTIPEIARRRHICRQRVHQILAALRVKIGRAQS